MVASFRRRLDSVMTRRALALTVGAISTSPSRSIPAEYAPRVPRPAAVGRVVGTVFDSLTMKPLSGASVWIAGSPLASTSDVTGKFLLDSVPEGHHQVTFATPELETAGFDALGGAVDVKGGADTHLKLASPSLRTLWKIMCARESGSVQDSGIVYGIVRDGDSHSRLVKAPTAFSWTGMNVSLKKFDFAPSTKLAISDSTGAYYACGLPSGTALSIRAYGNKAASGEIEHVLGENRVARIDFTVTQDLASVDSTHGRGTIRGYVLSAENLPVADAVVSVASSDTTVRTDSTGLFVLQHIPAGTQSLQVRKIGLASTAQTVDLIPGRTTESRVRMTKTTVLGTVNVRATATKSVYYEAYLDRRKLGLGTAISFDTHSFPDLVSPLLTQARVVVKKDDTGCGPTGRMGAAPPGGPRNGTQCGRGPRIIRMKFGMTDCTPRLYLDGGLVSEEIIYNIDPDKIRVVEIFASAFILPPQFMGEALGGAMVGGKNPPCGAIAWWTKTAFPE